MPCSSTRPQVLPEALAVVSELVVAAVLRSALLRSIVHPVHGRRSLQLIQDVLGFVQNDVLQGCHIILFKFGAEDVGQPDWELFVGHV